MALELLNIYNARNLKEYTLSPHSSYNILYGSNGVGKTTILESIYLLLRSKTFRSSKYKSFINHNSNTCTIFSRFSDSEKDLISSSFTLGISRSKDSLNPVLHLNSQKVNSLSSITNLAILGLITPESFTLLDAGPSIRRKFIDWGVFHVEPGFLSEWKAYKKILLNRNTLLKNLSKQYKSLHSIPDNLRDNIECWNPQFISLNNKLHELRSKQTQNISKTFSKYLSIFSTTLSENIKLQYYQGWSNEISYDEYLLKKLNEDFLAGYTRYGTHRADIRIILNKHPAKDILSRGQKKIVVICLILAQFSYLINIVNTTDHNLLLLDDIDSELDMTNLQLLFQILENLGTQVFVTTTNKEKYSFLSEIDSQLFHVEQ